MKIKTKLELGKETWYSFAREHELDGSLIVKTSHGRRTIETLAQYTPHLATPEFVEQFESLLYKKHGHKATVLPNANILPVRLSDLSIPWGIVTSGTPSIANGWMRSLELDKEDRKPRVMVTGLDLSHGKPAPDGYNLAFRLLGLDGVVNDRNRVVVFEDAPAGIEAGKRAGFTVVGVCTSHSLEAVKLAGPHYIVKDLDRVRIENKEMVIDCIDV